MFNYDSIANAMQLCIHFEGFSPVAYICPAGVPTIGYGTTGSAAKAAGFPLTPGLKINKEQAAHLLRFQLVDDQKYLAKTVPCWDKLYPWQQAALLSFVYNTGWVFGAQGFDTLNRAVEAADRTPRIAAALGLYIKGGGVVLPGLVTRRRAESAMVANKLTAREALGICN
jgi:lysozyme